MATEITSVGLASKTKVSVHLQVDSDLQIAVTIDNLPGDRDNWTLGQIKKAAIESAGSKIPRA